MELDGSNNVVRKYTWGLDLAGQDGSVNSLEGAGTIGGLLATWVQTTVGYHSHAFAYTYDANGNVSEVVDAYYLPEEPENAIMAHYEYTPFGRLLAHTGAYADENPFRFSTKYWDDETGLGYWDYRYYSPTLGRWISRDPMEELGHVRIKRSLQSRNWLSEADAIAILNAYDYVRNDPLAGVDPFGEIYWRSGDQYCGPSVWTLVGKWCASSEEFDAASGAFWDKAVGQVECFLNCEVVTHVAVCGCAAGAVCPLPYGKKIAEWIGLRVIRGPGMSPNTTAGRILASLITQKLGPRMGCAKVSGGFMHRVLSEVKRLRFGPAVAKTVVITECGIAIGCSAYCLSQGW